MNETRENVLEIYRTLDTENVFRRGIYENDDEEVIGYAADEAVAMDGDELRDIMRFCDVELDMLSDEVCLKAYGELVKSFKKRNNEELSMLLNDYRTDLWRKGLRKSMPYLQSVKAKWLRRMLKSDFMEEMEHTELDISDKYNEEVKYADGQRMVNVSLMPRYAFFRNYFDCKDGKYSLKSKAMLARYVYQNDERITDDVLDEFFMNVSMLEAVQISIDDLIWKDDHRLSEIKDFKPFEVLDYVEKVSMFEEREKGEVRKMWVQLMLQNNLIKMKSRRRIVNCFSINAGVDGFNKRFVLGVMGMMRKKGIYVGEATAMSKELEDSELEAGSIEQYLCVMLKGLRVTDESMKLIREIIGGTRG